MVKSMLNFNVGFEQDINILNVENALYIGTSSSSPELIDNVFLNAYTANGMYYFKYVSASNTSVMLMFVNEIDGVVIQKIIDSYNNNLYIRTYSGNEWTVDTDTILTQKNSETVDALPLEVVDEIVNSVFTFSILNYEYKAEEGMTWRDFLGSKYNVPQYRTLDNGFEVVEFGPLYLSYNKVQNAITDCSIRLRDEDRTDVLPTDLIIPGYAYGVNV